MPWKFWKESRLRESWASQLCWHESGRCHLEDWAHLSLQMLISCWDRDAKIPGNFCVRVIHLHLMQVLNVPRLTTLTYWHNHQTAAFDLVNTSHNLREAVLNVEPAHAHLAKKFSALSKLTLNAVAIMFRESDIETLSEIRNLSSLAIHGYAPLHGSILRAFMAFERYAFISDCDPVLESHSALLSRVSAPRRTWSFKLK